MTNLEQFSDLCAAYRRDLDECENRREGRSDLRSSLPGELGFRILSEDELADVDSARLARSLFHRAHDVSNGNAGSPSRLLPIAAIGMILVGGGLQLAVDGRELNLLSFPMLGILVWNLAMYVILAVLALRGGNGRPAVSTLLARISNRLNDNAGSSRPDPLLMKAAIPVWTGRARFWLHLGAALFAIGAVSSLYVRGLGTAYSAGWESTFLEARQVRTILSILLGPASALTGITLPDESTIAAMRFGSGEMESARRWIHLFATTLGIFAIIPRLILAAQAGWTARQESRSIRLPDEIDAFYRGLLKPVPPVNERLHVITFGGVAGSAADRVNRLLELAACPVRVSHFHKVDYGFEAPDLPAQLINARESGTGWITAFPVTTTPEREVHGRFIEALAANAGRECVLTVLDTAGFTTRFSNLADFPERLEGRCRLWRTLADEHGLRTFEVNLDNPEPGGWNEPLREFVKHIENHPA